MVDGTDMTTTSQLVERHLENDIVLNEALARGFLSVRRAARRLIDERGWDATEEAVVSAIRRYDPSPSVDLENVFHLLGQTRKTAQTGLGLIQVPHTQAFVSAIPRIANELEPEMTLGFVPDNEFLNILVDDQNVDRVTRILLQGSDAPSQMRIDRGLGKIELEFPESSPVNSAALAVVLFYLGHREVDVVNVYSTFPICSVYVRETDFADAYELTKELQLRESG